MRLVHLSDLHLGFRAFPREERGWNLRERDVAGAFRRAVHEILDVGPELILITGDLFDRPDPPSTAFLTLLRGLDTLRRRLPGAPILVVAGARDTPWNPADPGPVAALDSLPGVEAAAGAARAVRLGSSGIHALLVPHRAVAEPPHPELRPDPEARWNLLLIRGRPGGGTGAPRIRRSEWDYVAMGGDHVHGIGGDRAWWPGSLERLGWDPWLEATEEKGFVVYDLEQGEGEFHPVPSRPVVDLAPVRASPADPAAGTRRLRDVLKGVPGGIQGKILRVRLRGDLLTPDEGAASGLLAAVRDRTAHVEFLLLGDGAGDPWIQDMGAAGGAGCRVTGVVAGTGRLGGRALEILARRWNDERGEAEGRPDPLRDLIRTGGGDPVRILREGMKLLGAGDEPPVEEVVEGQVEEDVNEDLAEMERELSLVRADAVEAAGEMEAGNLEWARSRQDAESRLQAYRDRAREIRSRIRELEREGEAAGCPTCGRPVGKALPGLLATLKEEWEGVVQDGRWWKRRREQMDGKPEGLRRLEGQALALQARLESLSEQVERARERRRWKGKDGSGAVPVGRGETVDGKGWDVPARDRPLLRRVLRRGGTLIHLLSQGRLAGLEWDEGALRVREAAGEPRAPEAGEQPPLAFVLQLAFWLMVREGDRDVSEFLFGGFAAEGSEEAGARAVALLRRVLPPGARAGLVLPIGAVERVPEALDQILEVDGDPPDLRLREHPGGRPELRLV